MAAMITPVEVVVSEAGTNITSVVPASAVPASAVPASAVPASAVPHLYSSTYVVPIAWQTDTLTHFRWMNSWTWLMQADRQTT